MRCTEPRRLFPHDGGDAKVLLEGQGERQAREACADDNHFRLGHVTELGKVLWRLAGGAGLSGDTCGGGGGGGARGAAAIPGTLV